MIDDDTLTSALQGDREAMRALRDQINGTPSPTQEQIAAKYGRERADYRHNVNKMIEEGDFKDLAEDPQIWADVVERDKDLLVLNPNSSGEDRVAALLPAARRKYGTEAQRVILEKINERRATHGEPPLQFQPQQPLSEDDEFWQDYNAGTAEGIDAIRSGKGTRLADIRGRTRTNDT